ncbi:MAG: mannose-6-phosphate isomerase, class I [Actinomycetaceae bacterium]|nr:mannose-6-phosphate isomerase, class I [Actinomycetaceae bacterium]MDY6082717.1 mannose-6-phosphate isomerase, class I [Actinomycetaceae bacterium]
MKRLIGNVRAYSWGSVSAIPGLLGLPPADHPVAEVWFGAHPDASAYLTADTAALFVRNEDLYTTPERVKSSTGNSEVSGVRRAQGVETGVDTTVCAAAQCPEDETLRAYIARRPTQILGQDVAEHFHGELPYLLKLLAADQPLSLQVHPSLEQAQEGFEREERQGVPRSSHTRNYKDANHKPELIYALSPFFALAGFRAPRRILSVLEGVNTPVVDAVAQLIRSRGVRPAFEFLLSDPSARMPEAISAVAQGCQSRRGVSPSRASDDVVQVLASKYPHDPGVIASLLLNPVLLRPGEALFLPAGMVHSYISGLGVEIMANSDNVLRAGLTNKHVDVPELLRIVSTQAAPPIRIAPEIESRYVSTFYAPVDDFQLSSIRLTDASIFVPIPGSGPRTLVCVEGAAQVSTHEETMALNVGQSLFVDSSEGAIVMRGFGHLVQATVA